MLLQAFSSAWGAIKESYQKQPYCSERHFQCDLFYFLKSCPGFTENGYRLVVEPVINAGALRNIIPDMIIIKDQVIEAIVELKYVPHGYIQFEKDVRNMSAFYMQKDSSLRFNLIGDPGTGQWDVNQQCSLSKNLILIYVFITNSDSFAITNTKEIWDEKYSGLNEVPNNAIFYGGLKSGGQQVWHPNK